MMSEVGADKLLLQSYFEGMKGISGKCVVQRRAAPSSSASYDQALTQQYLGGE